MSSDRTPPAHPAPATLWTLDADGRIRDLGPAGTELLGVAPGATTDDVAHRNPLTPQSVARLAALWERALAEGVNEIRFPAEHRRSDGSTRWCDVLVLLVRDAGGRVSQGLGVRLGPGDSGRDGMALERIERAVDQSDEGITLLDRAGRILYANAAFARMMGGDAEPLLGSPFEALARGGDDHELLARVTETLQKGETWRGRYRTTWEDGTSFVRHATVTPVRDSDGRTSGYVGVIRDMTRETQLEDQLHQAQRLEAIGQLAGGVAHDFNNLLTVITGYAEVLARDLRDRPGAREAAGEIRDAAELATTLTQQLLAFGRRQVRQPQRLDLNARIRTGIGLLRRLLREDIELRCSLSEGIGSVEADPGQIEQILLNLVANARDAMPAGGRLWIHTLEVTLGADRPARLAGLPTGPYVVLRVRDSGTGMDAQTLSRVFDPFFTTKDPARGTGLGLASVLGIVEQSGGGIDVSSRPGSGTTIDVHLPRCSAISAQAADADAGRPGPRQQVLVVEDDERIRRLLAAALESAGFAVLQAADGVAALEGIESRGERIDLLVTDVVMPRLSGPRLAERLRARQGELSVIYVSGYADEELGGHGIPSDCVDFLPKPFSPRELVAKAREAVSRR